MQTTLSYFVSFLTGCVNIMTVFSRFLTLQFKNSIMLFSERGLHFNSNSFVFMVPDPSSSRHATFQSHFDVELKTKWRAASDSGICRYQLKLETKILPGKFNLVSQLNVNRATLRRRPQDMQQVNPAFDPEQFNFNKVPPQEILMKFKNEDCDDQTGEDSVLIINVSPLEFGNCLLVPRVSDSIRQKVTLDGLQLLINVMLLSTDPNLRSGFNSPGGYSSVNHQHYHLYYLEERLYLEKAQVEHICGPCFALTSFPSKAFAFQLDDSPSKLAKDVFTLVSYLAKNNIAHNLYLTRGKRFFDSQKDSYETLRVFVWAREPAFGVKEEIGFNPALCELAGHLLIKEPPNYESVTEDVAVAMLEEVTKPWFQKVLPFINELYTPPLEG